MTQERVVVTWFRRPVAFVGVTVPGLSPAVAQCSRHVANRTFDYTLGSGVFDWGSGGGQYSPIPIPSSLGVGRLHVLSQLAFFRADPAVSCDLVEYNRHLWTVTDGDRSADSGLRVSMRFGGLLDGRTETW